MSNEYPPAGSGQEPEQPHPQDQPSHQPPHQSYGQQPYGQPPEFPPGPPQGGGQGGGWQQQGSYGQSYGGPGAGYPPGPYGPYAEQKTSPLAIVSLVLGIVGLCCASAFVVSIAAIVTGVIGRKQVAESGGRLKGGGMALAGLILGGVGILFGVVYWILIASGVIDMNLVGTST